MIKVRKDIAFVYIVDYKKSEKLWCGNPGPPELSKLDSRKSHLCSRLGQILFFDTYVS